MRQRPMPSDDSPRWHTPPQMAPPVPDRQRPLPWQWLLHEWKELQFQEARREKWLCAVTQWLEDEERHAGQDQLQAKPQGESLMAHPFVSKFAVHAEDWTPQCTPQMQPDATQVQGQERVIESGEQCSNEEVDSLRTGVSNNDVAETETPRSITSKTSSQNTPPSPMTTRRRRSARTMKKLAGTEDNNTFRRRLWILLEDPNASWSAFYAHKLYSIIIVLSVLCTIAETMPRSPSGKGGDTGSTLSLFFHHPSKLVRLCGPQHIQNIQKQKLYISSKLKIYLAISKIENTYYYF